MTQLRQRMLEDMGIRNLAENTQSADLLQIIAYAKYFQRPPEELAPDDIRASQSGLQWAHFALTIAYASSKVDPERTASSTATTPVGPEQDKNLLTSWPATV
jgi:hypothetical protein